VTTSNNLMIVFQWSQQRT